MLVFSLNSSEGSQSRVPSAASVIRTPPVGSSGSSWNVAASMGRPSAVHGQGRAGDKRGLGRAQKGDELGDLDRLDEAFDRGVRQHDLLDHLCFRYPPGPGLTGDLAFDERCPHEGRADAVRRYAFGPSLQGDDLR